MKTFFLVVVSLALTVLAAARAPRFLGVSGLVLFGVSQILALLWVAPDAHMREAGRILYVHVPAAWMSMVAFTAAFVGALGALFAGDESRPLPRLGWDAVVEAAVEVGVLLNVLLLLLGMTFAKPTWGVFWSWDPRLTASAVMCLTFVGVALLRQFLVDDPDRRALWTAIATVLAYVNIPVTYMSVKWWRSLHQTQSNPNSMDGDMTFVLRLSAFAFLFLMFSAIVARYHVARARAAAELPPPLPGESAAAVQSPPMLAPIWLWGGGGVLGVLPIASIGLKTALVGQRVGLVAALGTGWSYVIAAYVLTWAFFLAYAASLVIRYRKIVEGGA